MENSRPLALVTGANRGIGRAISVWLARGGYDIVGVDLAENHDTTVTRREVQQQGARVAWVAADIADLELHEGVVDAAYELGGRLDVLVNNAGISVARRGDVLDVTPESFDRVLDVNLRGTFFLSQAAARRMLADDSGATARAVITVTSANAIIASPDRAEYCLSKTALSMMVRILALRLADAGIASYEVRPGIIRTDMTRVATERYDRLIGEGLTPIRRWGEPDDVGRAVAALASGAIPFTTGEAVHVDGGLHIQRL